MQFCIACKEPDNSGKPKNEEIPPDNWFEEPETTPPLEDWIIEPETAPPPEKEEKSAELLPLFKEIRIPLEYSTCADV
jgi:hypothetical protein